MFPLPWQTKKPKPQDLATEFEDAFYQIQAPSEDPADHQDVGDNRRMLVPIQPQKGPVQPKVDTKYSEFEIDLNNIESKFGLSAAFQLLDMGFSQYQSVFALNKCGGNVEASVTYLLEHSVDTNSQISHSKLIKQSSAKAPQPIPVPNENKPLPANTGNVTISEVSKKGNSNQVSSSKKAAVAKETVEDIHHSYIPPQNPHFVDESENDAVLEEMLENPELFGDYGNFSTEEPNEVEETFRPNNVSVISQVEETNVIPPAEEETRKPIPSTMSEDYGDMHIISTMSTFNMHFVESDASLSRSTKKDQSRKVPAIIEQQNEIIIPPTQTTTATTVMDESLGSDVEDDQINAIVDLETFFAESQNNIPAAVEVEEVALVEVVAPVEEVGEEVARVEEIIPSIQENNVHEEEVQQEVQEEIHEEAVPEEEVMISNENNNVVEPTTTILPTNNAEQTTTILPTSSTISHEEESDLFDAMENIDFIHHHREVESDTHSIISVISPSAPSTDDLASIGGETEDSSGRHEMTSLPVESSLPVFNDEETTSNSIFAPSPATPNRIAYTSVPSARVSSVIPIMPFARRRKYLPYQTLQVENYKYKAIITMKQFRLKKGEVSPQGNRPDSLALGVCNTREICIDLCESVAPPTWSGKQDIQQCSICHIAFNILFNKGHHCRNCGHFVCVNCSDKLWPTTMLPSTYFFNEKIVRVCHSCHYLMELFIQALKNGDITVVKAIYASGNINLHNPYGMYGNFAYPVSLFFFSSNIPLILFHFTL